MMSSTDIRPTMARSAPESTSWVKPTMPSCCCRKRWAAARIASSLPPTFTIATPSRLAFTPRRVTAPRTATGMSPAGQVEGELLLDERDHEDPATDHDLLAAVVDADLPGLRVDGFLAAPSGDDERLVGPRHLVAGDDDEGEQDEEYDDSCDGDNDWAHIGSPCLPRGRQFEWWSALGGR